MNAVNALGLCAGLLTTVAFLPQVVKTWRERSARGVSTGMFILLCAGVSLWVIYGLLIRSTPVVVTNGAVLALASTNLMLKLRYPG